MIKSDTKICKNQVSILTFKMMGMCFALRLKNCANCYCFDLMCFDLLKEWINVDS